MANPNNPLRKLNAAGQSVWCDNIHRAMLTSGGLLTMIEDDDLRGITSNPAIFDKAISTGHEYDAILERELRRDRHQSPRALFFALAIEDIRDAADAMRPVYEPDGRCRRDGEPRGLARPRPRHRGDLARGARAARPPRAGPTS